MGLVEALTEHFSVKSALLLIVVVFSLWKISERIDETRRLKKLGNRGPQITTPAPFGLDFIYHAIQSTLKQTNLEMWRSWFHRLGVWTVEVRALNQRFVFTADPENIKAILATQFTDYGKGAPFNDEFQPFLGDSIFTTDGNKWHTSRQLIRPQFTRDRVSDLHCFEAHMQTFFKALANGGPLDGENQAVDMSRANGRILNVSDMFFRYTLDVATEFLLGHDVKSMTTIKNSFAEAFNEVQRMQNLISRANKLRHVLPKSTYWAGLKVLNAFVNQYIERALRLSPEELAENTKSDKDYTFLHELASFTRDPKVIRDQIVAVLLAGRDTTAATLSWAIYELGRTPHAVAKLRAEVLERVGRDRTPSYEDLKEMPYLRAVLNETLRMYPSVPFNVRMALKDTTLPRGGGKDGSEPMPVLKDTPVGYSTLVMQRRPDLYPPVSETFADPEVFSPERWATWHPKPHYYIPFNAGPRICIGQQFALTEMSYVLCRLFQKFERVESHMQAVDGGSPMLKAEIVLSPGQGVLVSFWEPKE